MTKRTDPFLGCNFLLELDGGIQAGFHEASGLSAEVEVEPYYEGGINNQPYFVLKTAKFTEITLKRGFVADDRLWKWFNDTLWGKPTEKSGSILLVDEKKKVLVTWNFYMGLLTKWAGPEFKASSAAVALETLSIVHKGLEVKFK